MKSFANTMLAAVVGLSMPIAAVAQQQVTTPPLAGETALAYAQRINACGGAAIAGAEFFNGGSLLRVQCLGGGGTTDTGGLSGGLGGALAAGGLVVALFAIAGSEGSGVFSTTSTPGTN